MGFEKEGRLIFGEIWDVVVVENRGNRVDREIKKWGSVDKSRRTGCIANSNQEVKK